MTGVRAFAVVSQDLDHSTRCDMSVAASVHHQFKFGLERVEAADALLDIGQASLGDAIGFRAGLAGVVLQCQQCADRLDFESQFPRVPNKGEATQVGLAIVAAVTLAAGWGRQQPNLLVIADGRRLHAAVLSRLADWDALYQFACSSSG